MNKNLMGRVWDFLGLVEDEDAWNPPPASTAADVHSPSSGNVRLLSPKTPDSHPVSSVLRTEVPSMPREHLAVPLGVETEVLQVDGFQDCPHLTSWYKAGVPVMLDLRSLPAETAQGVVYYATGLTSYNQGQVSQVGDGLVLVTPPGASVSQSEKARLAKIGMWRSSTGI
ncbi:MAG: cell division protein SepF [Actinomycetia bacterium]|nr:cell division protein SepF [Actinomycetes bacterium]